MQLRIAVLLFLPLGILSAQRVDLPARLSGSLHADLLLSTHASADSSVPMPSGDRLSPLRAALYSAVLPGAGQFYAESYWQAAAFAVAEATLWIIYANNVSKGDDKTAEFQAYADVRWSVARYVAWMQTYYGGQVADLYAIIGPSGVDWSLLNSCESQIARLATTGSPNGFTHVLPVRPAQQYYELIGKYPQYGGGWDDASSYKPGGFTPADLLASEVSPNFLYYRDQRGAANDFYNHATAASYVLVANHVLSALEAAWNASRVNKRIHLESRLVPIDRGVGRIEYVPMAMARIEM